MKTAHAIIGTTVMLHSALSRQIEARQETNIPDNLGSILQIPVPPTASIEIVPCYEGVKGFYDPRRPKKKNTGLRIGSYSSKSKSK